MCFLTEGKDRQEQSFSFSGGHLTAFFRSAILFGMVGRERIQYWKFLPCSLFTWPRLVPLAINLAILGFHLGKVTQGELLTLKNTSPGIDGSRQAGHMSLMDRPYPHPRNNAIFHRPIAKPMLAKGFRVTYLPSNHHLLSESVCHNVPAGT